VEAAQTFANLIQACSVTAGVVSVALVFFRVCRRAVNEI
jgi:hypothetical protein